MKTGGGMVRLGVRVPRLPLLGIDAARKLALAVEWPWERGMESSALKIRVPGVIGSMTGSNPVGQGSSPWGRALRMDRKRRTLHPVSGSSSNRRTPASHAGNLGASPSGSTAMNKRSCGPAARAAPLQGDDRWFESTQDYSGPDTPTGRAAWLKPRCLQVRFLLWAHGSVGNWQTTLT